MAQMEGRRMRGLFLGTIKLLAIFALLFGIISAALLEKQLIKVFNNVGLDEQIHNIKLLIIVSAIFCGWMIVSIIGSLFCRPRWTWLTGVLDIFFVCIIAVNMPLLLTLRNSFCGLKLENGICGFSCRMCESYITSVNDLYSDFAVSIQVRRRDRESLCDLDSDGQRLG
ncbi:unnamed protein product [Clonostachys rosea]|uniref:MARVEL domain-containing protein n=1 Tax=Bionectria ochroleuca TaxID=29856 RepID=A0ABY6UJN3_BIOOC|nr:unnamed protein product [Clonostachys rosea]